MDAALGCQDRGAREIQAMNAVAQLDRDERRQLWDRAVQNLGTLPPAMIEKDFWVCWTLAQIFALAGARDHFIFKGGTSLSKVWRVIHRFSEDIDVSLSREWLGFEGQRDPEGASSGKQRRRLLDELAKACACRLKNEVAPALRDAMAKVLGPKGWTLEIDADDPQTLLLAYPTALDDAPLMAYIRPMVRIECGARSDRWPMETAKVMPYVAEAFPDRIRDAAVELPVLGIERTFWEKATILHAEAHRPDATRAPARFSRHYSDLAAMADHTVATRALARDELRARVVAHKQAFFASGWTRYETAVPGTFRLLPDAQRLDALARDYASMREMFFAAPPPWNDVVQSLEALERKINRQGP